jgi:hypothetical protein
MSTFSVTYFAFQQFVESSGLNYFTQQMLHQTPTLLAALLGVLLSLIFMRRVRLPAFLALLGSGAVIIGALVVTVSQAYFFSTRFSPSPMFSDSSIMIANVVGWIGAVVRGLSIALLVVAIFVGRKGTTTTPSL